MDAVWHSGDDSAEGGRGGSGRDDARAFAELSARGDVEAAKHAIARGAFVTPTIASAELSELAGAPVLLKAESLQVSGSFKLRGALAKLAALGAPAGAGRV